MASTPAGRDASHSFHAFVARLQSGPTAYRLPVEVKNRAMDVVRVKLDLYAQCLARNEWPGYPGDIQLVDWPTWALTQEI